MKKYLCVGGPADGKWLPFDFKKQKYLIFREAPKLDIPFCIEGDTPEISKITSKDYTYRPEYFRTTEEKFMILVLNGIPIKDVMKYLINHYGGTPK